MGGARRFAALVLIGAMIFAVGAVAPATPAGADPQDDKRRIDAEVSRASATLETATARAQEAARLYAAANEALPGAEQRVGEARGRIAAASAQVKAAQREVAAARVDLDRATVAYMAAREQVDRARDELGGFIAATYKGSGVVALNVIVEARGPSELADRIGYLDFVVEQQREAVSQVVAARHEARVANDAAVAAGRRAVAAQQAAEGALADAEFERAAAESAVDELAGLTTQRRDALAVAAEERDASLGRYEELKAESARVEAELRAWEGRQRVVPGPVLRPGARMLMPVQGWKSSDFGMRYDPFYRVWQLHAGVDIAAGGGQPIYASGDGKVTRAGWYGGYGNYTCLYHGTYQGRGLATCYAHQSQVLVGAGQQVRRGQVIGRVGTTGASTGYHLHYEVRVGGAPVQPLDWLPDCLC